MVRPKLNRGHLARYGREDCYLNDMQIELKKSSPLLRSAFFRGGWGRGKAIINFRARLLFSLNLIPIFFYCSKAFSRVPFSASSHQIIDKKKLTEISFQLSYLTSNPYFEQPRSAGYRTVQYSK